LDVGCGTGRSLQYLSERHPDLDFSGIEPVQALRDIACQKKMASVKLLPGDACNLDFEDNQFDCVTMFGVLHHIPSPEKAICEALRVAKKIVFISDHNVYGMGSTLTKSVKQILRDLGLRPLMNQLLTKGKGYHDTTWDGIFYPFSLVDYADILSEGMSNFYTFSTKTPAINLYRDASHIAMLSVKPGASAR
jgi:ubiquinone/menaquinone biosynthesis C-methylase UbiE